ncbi:hypothetical protein AA309_29885 [Microvirga vignae]|uniref:Uncharacterized protein n=1 Tax=Microvirga vignae TaxID=1225564 RepID=A0A0H1RAU0_9HYPH|nr:hypothetical protein [Microvirga vignae]KLK89727.1 hypothetical protein AA309_29885 [Microvirga vignae]
MITAALGWLSVAASDPAFLYLGDETRVLRRGTAAQLVTRYGKLLTEVIEIQVRILPADGTQAARGKPLGVKAVHTPAAFIQDADT